MCVVYLHTYLGQCVKIFLKYARTEISRLQKRQFQPSYHVEAKHTYFACECDARKTNEKKNLKKY